MLAPRAVLDHTTQAATEQKKKKFLTGQGRNLPRFYSFQQDGAMCVLGHPVFGQAV